MTTTDYDTPALLERGADALHAAATAVGRQLPGGGNLTVEDPRALTEPINVLAGLSAEAVAVDVTGAATGRLTLVVTSPLAAAVQEGPIGAADLTAALTGPIADAVAALEGPAGGPLTPGLADAVEAGAIDFGPSATIVCLTDEGSTAAVLVVELDLPVEEDGPEPAPPAEEAAAFTPFVETGPPARLDRSMELLHDVEMAVTVELGRTRMAVADLLSLAPGAVVELDRAAGSPVDVLVNGKLIARGEVVVIDEDFGIRISEIVGLQQNNG